MIGEAAAQEMQGTARKAGAVGKKAVLPEIVKHRIQDGDRVLDFGAGPHKRHVQDIQAACPGARVEGYDFGDDWEATTAQEWDVVYASNVLNVQVTMHTLFATLDQLAMLQGTGRLFVNYPKEPRKLGLSVQDMKRALENHGWAVKEIEKGNSQVWELVKQ